MTTSFTIKTYEGREKVIRGHRRAIKLRKVVRDLFEEKARQNPSMSFTAICTEVGNKLDLTMPRVMQIMRGDYEYPLNYKPKTKPL